MRVSVLVMTYNHAGFIRQALDSALMQQVKGGSEVLISEDCSTDGTREIVREYARRYPQLIRLLLSAKNVRSNAIVVRGIEAAQGDYIALLDGDDYWLAPDKLQRQVDFLDVHPECALCFHNARVQHEESSAPAWNWTPPGHPEITTQDDLWLGNYIATCSTLFRRGLIGKIPAWYDDFFPITDWPLHLLNAEHGKIGYIADVLGVYRYHRGGYYSPLSQGSKLQETLKFYRRINACFDFKYNRQIQIAISKYFIEWAQEYLSRGNLPMARRCYRWYLTGRPINPFMRPRQMLSYAARLYLPQSLLPKRWRVSPTLATEPVRAASDRLNAPN